MANPEHLRILRQGVEKWNKWRRENPNVHPDFGEAGLRRALLRQAHLYRANLGAADLSAADLVWADFTEANLGTANLSGAFLTEARLRMADLREADLSGARLEFADLSSADLGGTRLCRAYVTGSNLRAAVLSSADFTEAVASGTNFSDVDLSDAKGLETIRHWGPSTIGIDAIYKSHGKIPEVFLRGCGFQDWEIELVKLYQPDLAAADLTTILYRVSELRSGAPIRYSSCFISYSTKDQEFADRLYADLQAKGVRCWFAPHDIQGGKTIHEQIDEAIRRYDRLLLILSEHSIHSGWVETEIANAWERQIQQEKHVLFPVRLVSFEELEKWKCPDPKTGKDLGREIRKYFIPDFSNWKDHDPYQEAFQRLVKDLKAGDS
jgi:uncharacterized protein YjbI with pentapeptide repeats